MAHTRWCKSGVALTKSLHRDHICFCLFVLFSYFLVQCSYSTSPPFTGVPFLQTPTNGKTTLSEVKTLWAIRLGESKTHEM